MPDSDEERKFKRKLANLHDKRKEAELELQYINHKDY
jgi:hypothetical protein